jgi:hypothetical protein
MNRDKHVWEGWTVGDFIDDLEPIFNMIITNRSHVKPFTNKQDLKNWVKDNQPYYKKHIPEVANYFIKKIGL